MVHCPTKNMHNSPISVNFANEHWLLCTKLSHETPIKYFQASSCVSAAEWQVDQCFEDGPQNVGLLAIQLPDTAASTRIFY